MEPASTPRRPAVRALAAALAVLVVGAVLPIWQAYYVGPWEVTGERTQLWTAMVQLPDSARIGHRSIWDAQWTNAVAAVVLLAVAGGAAAWAFRADRRPEMPDEQRDYKEESGGSIMDGRSSSRPGTSNA